MCLDIKASGFAIGIGMLVLSAAAESREVVSQTKAPLAMAPSPDGSGTVQYIKQCPGGYTLQRFNSNLSPQFVDNHVCLKDEGSSIRCEGTVTYAAGEADYCQARLSGARPDASTPRVSCSNGGLLVFDYYSDNRDGCFTVKRPQWVDCIPEARTVTDSFNGTPRLVPGSCMNEYLLWSPAGRNVPRSELMSRPVWSAGEQRWSCAPGTSREGVPQGCAAKFFSEE